MLFNYNGYLNCELPENWCSEEDNDSLIVYDPDGNGAMVISFFNIFKETKNLDEQISIFAKRFIDKNNISLHNPLILSHKKEKATLYGTGTTLDKWFVKLWITAKYPKLVLATYQSEQCNKEIKTCDAIIDSMTFTF